MKRPDCKNCLCSPYREYAYAVPACGRGRSSNMLKSVTGRLLAGRIYGKAEGQKQHLTATSISIVRIPVFVYYLVLFFLFFEWRLCKFGAEKELQKAPNVRYRNFLSETLFMGRSVLVFPGRSSRPLQPESSPPRLGGIRGSFRRDKNTRREWRAPSRD